MSGPKKAARPRGGWCPSIQKTNDAFVMTLKYKQSRGDVVPFSKSHKNQIKVPWGPPNSCVMGRDTSSEGTDVFLR